MNIKSNNACRVLSTECSSKIKALDKWQLSYTRSAYYVPGTMLSSGDTMVNQRELLRLHHARVGRAEGPASASSTACDCWEGGSREGWKLPTQPWVPDFPAEASVFGHLHTGARAPGPPAWVQVRTCHRSRGRGARRPSQPCVPAPAQHHGDSRHLKVFLSISFSVSLTELSSL